MAEKGGADPSGRTRGRRIHGDAVRVGKSFGVLESGVHVSVTRKRPEILIGIVVDRGLFAKALVDRIGVLVELVGVMAKTPWWPQLFGGSDMTLVSRYSSEAHLAHSRGPVRFVCTRRRGVFDMETIGPR